MNIVSIHSHKGGSGKTTIAIGVAAILSRDNKVCLVEADIVGAGLEYSIGFTPRGKYLNHFLLPHRSKGIKEEIEELLIEIPGDWIESGKLFVIPCTASDPRLIDRTSGLEERERIRGELITKLADLVEVLQNDFKFDYCIFDCSPGLSGMSISVLRTTLENDGVTIFVATPDRSHIIGLFQELQLFQDAKVISGKRTILVINQVPPEPELIDRFSDINGLSKAIAADEILKQRKEDYSSGWELSYLYQHITHDARINKQFYLAGSEGNILISDIEETNIKALADKIREIF